MIISESLSPFILRQDLNAVGITVFIPQRHRVRVITAVFVAARSLNIRTVGIRAHPFKRIRRRGCAASRFCRNKRLVSNNSVVINIEEGDAVGTRELPFRFMRPVFVRRSRGNTQRHNPARSGHRIDRDATLASKIGRASCRERV